MWSPRCTAITSTKDVTSTCAALNYRTLPPVWQMPHILADTESITSVVFLAQPVAAVYRGLTAKL